MMGRGFMTTDSSDIKPPYDVARHVSHNAPQGLYDYTWPKCIPAIYNSYGNVQAVAEATEPLQFLENELNVKGKKFFGGDNIGLVDICACYMAFWVGAAEEALESR
ncbi:putative glutathione transferase [Helianthus annuus]|nr:putative glutathione transferase [Helianthus annuus]KAJ0573512.1 putative glutathione transferase [Helianthus annuus]KAJ0911829.1 putative glutathione transferase [Helianthus annuus]